MNKGCLQIKAGAVMAASGYQGGGEIGGCACTCLFRMLHVACMYVCRYVCVHVFMLVFRGQASARHGHVVLNHFHPVF